MAQSDIYDLHDEPLIHRNRLSMRYSAALSTTVLGSHPVIAYSVAWNASGDILASSANDSSVYLWSPQEGRRVAHNGFTKHGTSVNLVRWSPVSNHTLGTTSKDCGVLLWDHRDGGTSPVAIFERTKSAHMDPLWFDFSGDGSKVAIAEQTGRHASKLTIYDVRQQMALDHSLSIPNATSAMKWTHDTDLIALGTPPGLMYCVGAPLASENPLTTTISAHNANVLTMDSTKGILATGGSDSMTQIWDTSSLACLASFSHADSSVRCVSISPNSQVIASAYEQGIALYTSNGHSLSTVPVSSWTIAWHPWRSIIAHGGESHTKESGKFSGPIGITSFES